MNKGLTKAGEAFLERDRGISCPPGGQQVALDLAPVGVKHDDDQASVVAGAGADVERGVRPRRQGRQGAGDHHPAAAPKARKPPPAPAGTRISDRALVALRGAVVREDCVTLPPEQLGRETYLEVAGVLETVGAKWHKGRKVHVFAPTWDRGMFEDVRATGVAPPSNPLAYFATPRKVADELLNDQAVSDALLTIAPIRVLEPSAGTGALAVATVERWVAWAKASDLEAATMSAAWVEWYGANQPMLHLMLVEVDERRVRILRSTLAPRLEAMLPGRVTVEVVAGDFLELGADQLGRVDVVVMNPPFSLPGDRSAWWTHMRHAIKVVDRRRGVVACIAPPAWRHQERGDMLEAIAAISRGSAWNFPAGAFDESGTGIATTGIVVRADDALDDDPDTDRAEILITNERELADRVIKAADAVRVWRAPAHDDPKSDWRRTLFSVCLVVARGTPELDLPAVRRPGRVVQQEEAVIRGDDEASHAGFAQERPGGAQAVEHDVERGEADERGVGLAEIVDLAAVDDDEVGAADRLAQRLGGEPVSFSESWQRKISRRLWRWAAEVLGIDAGSDAASAPAADAGSDQASRAAGSPTGSCSPG